MVSNGEYNENIQVNHDISLIGINKPIIDGNEIYSCISIEGKYNVLIEGFIIQHSKKLEWHDGSGGGINNKGVLFVKNCEIRNNFAVSGAAIYNDKESHLNLEGCDIHDNTASVSGAAISNEYRGNATVKSCCMHNNNANWYGGSISNHGELTLEKCGIYSNVAGFDSGAIHNSGCLTVKKCGIYENTAKYDGGAITNWGQGQLLLESCNIHHNIAKKSGGIYMSSGSGFWDYYTKKHTINNKPNNVQGKPLKNI